MVTISRKLARTLRTVFRKANEGHQRRESGVVQFLAKDGRLRVQFQNDGVGVQFDGDEHANDEAVALPLSAFDAFEGAKEDRVQLQTDQQGAVTATWTDHGVPQSRRYPANKAQFEWLDRPAMVVNEGGMTDLDDVMSCAAREQVRFALNGILLRGRGEAVGSDGRHLLIVRGFQFPWQDDVLIRRTSLFSARDLNDVVNLEIGRTQKHVVFQLGQWTIWLPIMEGRFPNVDQIIPKAGQETKLVLSEDDAIFLEEALPRLPVDENGSDAPVTIDAKDQVLIRAKSSDGQVTELALCQSRIQGQSVQVAVNRPYLLKAIQLGFRELKLVNDQTPIVATDERRTFVWQPLSKTAIVRSTKGAHRIELSSIQSEPSNSIEERPNETMNTNTQQQVPNEADQGDETAVDPIQEAEAIKGQLRDAIGRLGELVISLKRQRRQAQLVRSTLASLKQLQNVA